MQQLLKLSHVNDTRLAPIPSRSGPKSQPKCPESLALLFWPYRFDLEACAHQARRGGASRNESAADTLEAAGAID
jgi:hypothetical protein